MTDYPITCPTCGRRVGWSDIEGVQIPCSAHAVDFPPTGTSNPAEVHESTTTGTVVGGLCLLEALGMLAMFVALLVAVL
jgi:hypothetical protein